MLNCWINICTINPYLKSNQFPLSVNAQFWLSFVCQVTYLPHEPLYIIRCLQVSSRHLFSLFYCFSFFHCFSSLFLKYDGKRSENAKKLILTSKLNMKHTCISFYLKMYFQPTWRVWQLQDFQKEWVHIQRGNWPIAT